MSGIPQGLFYKYLADLDLADDQISTVAAIVTAVTPILHYLPQGIPFFTDHGLLHSSNVLRYVRDLTKEYPIKLTQEEKFILALSSYLHDIGCISGREEHNKKTLKVLAKDHFNFIRDMIGPIFYKALECVIIAHSSFDLSKLPDDSTSEVRLKLICSIFRLADGCDISSNRIKKLLLEVLLEEKQLDKETEKIWKSHLAIENIKVDGTRLVAKIYDNTEAKYCLDHLNEELSLINAILSKNEFPVFKLEIEVVDRSILDNREL